jgi:hypothetical protein
MIIFDTNQYSVPEYLAQKLLSIHSSASFVEVYDGKNRVATHPRVFERGKKIVNPIHRKNETVGEDPRKTA